MLITISEASKFKNSGEDITVKGWVQFCRIQKKVSFLEIRDGTQSFYLQSVFKTEQNEILVQNKVCEETCLEITGKIIDAPTAKGGIELVVGSFEVIGTSAASFNTEKNNVDTRHLKIRSPKFQTVFRLRSSIIQCFRDFFFSRGFNEVSPPSLTTGQVEGGSTLFDMDFFGKKAFLSQSSQFYLETIVPSIGNCFSIVYSFRAEKSHTKRHLAEYLHLEIEMPFIDFEGLLKIVSETLIEVTRKAMEKFRKEIRELHSELSDSQFENKFLFLNRKDNSLKRLTHKDAISFCNQNGILSDEGKEFAENEDISEAPERKMVELIGEPVLLTNFPACQKPFYMKKTLTSEDFTESVDLLLPGVGEVLGGSMRENNLEKLENNIKKYGLNVNDYKWYTDLRKYGQSNTGGYGLGIERYLCWILNKDTIRKVTAYPRYEGNCYP